MSEWTNQRIAGSKSDCLGFDTLEQSLEVIE